MGRRSTKGLLMQALAAAAALWVVLPATARCEDDPLTKPLKTDVAGNQSDLGPLLWRVAVSAGTAVVWPGNEGLRAYGVTVRVRQGNPVADALDAMKLVWHRQGKMIVVTDRANPWDPPEKQAAVLARRAETDWPPVLQGPGVWHVAAPTSAIPYWPAPETAAGLDRQGGVPETAIQKRITGEFPAANALAVLERLSDTLGWPIALEPEVQSEAPASVSASLANASAVDALDMVLRAMNLCGRFEANDFYTGIRIARLLGWDRGRPGAQQAGTAQAPGPAEPPGTPANQAPRVCPKDGTVLQPGWRFCPKCGEQIDKQPVDWVVCPYCGRPLKKHD